MQSKTPIDTVPWHSIALCPNGHVLLRLGITTVHLTFQDFKELCATSSNFLEQCHRNPQWLDAEIPNLEFHH